VIRKYIDGIASWMIARGRGKRSNGSRVRDSYGFPSGAVRWAITCTDAATLAVFVECCGVREGRKMHCVHVREAGRLDDDASIDATSVDPYERY
jgi:hypothetical protein